MPTYFAGWVLGSGTIKSGNGFTISRLSVSGSYRITIQPTPNGFFLITNVTAFAPNSIGRVVQYSKDAITKVHTIDIEVRDLTTGALMDSDFMFITVERS